MSDVTLSPNMNLPVPTVGIDTGPDWANNLNASLSILDQHNHSSGSGVPIQPSGLNINSNLSFQNNQATGLQACAFTAQASVTTLDSLYVKGVDLYYRDGSNNEVQITTGGTVNATSSGISSGTATASFVASVLVVNAASTTPANIKGGSILLGNNTAGSKYLTLAPPNAMAANYGLTLPSLPVSQKIMTLDAAGSMGAPYTVDGSTIAISANVIGVPAGGIGATQLADSAVTTAKISDSAVTTSKVADSAITAAKRVANYFISNSSGAFNFTSSTPDTVTNLEFTFRNYTSPVQILLVPDTSGIGSYLNGGSGSGMKVGLYLNGTLQQVVFVNANNYATTASFVVDPAPNNYTYTIKVSSVDNASTVVVAYMRAFAQEI